MKKTLLVLLSLVACSAAKEAPLSSDAAAPTEATAEATASVEEAPAKPHTGSRIDIQASLEFISVKNEDTPVSGTIVGVSGSASVEPGEGGLMGLDGVLEIPLTGFDTALAPRDANIQNAFFHVSETPMARFHLQKMQHPKPGTAGMWIEGKLEIGPFSQPIRGHFRASTNEDGSMSLESGEAMVVSIDKLGMGERLAALMALCGHKTVDDSVEVRASGTLRLVAGQ